MDVKKVFEDAAGELGYNFAYGTRPFINYEATLKDMKENQYSIFVFPPTENDEYNNKIVPSRTRYTVTFQIATKFEKTTTSSLDETYYQKHERRLLTLRTLCRAFAKKIFCENNVMPVSARYSPEINVYATTVDAYNCEVVFNDVS